MQFSINYFHIQSVVSILNHCYDHGRYIGKGMKMRKILIFLFMVQLGFSGLSQAEYVKISDELTIHYEISGQGEKNILFVPGWTFTTKVYEKQLEYFKDSTEYRFITYDPRGQGLSTKTMGGHYYEQHGRDLNAFIEGLNLDNVILGGWSFGGLDILAYVNQFGIEKLKGFVMIDAAPNTKGQDNTKDWIWYNYNDSDQFEEFFTMGPLRDRDGTNHAVAEWMLENTSEENIKWAIGQSNQTHDTVAATLNASATFLDYTEDLKKMEGNVPLLYTVRGEWKEIVSNWAIINTPSARVEAFGKHLFFWERSEQYNEVLSRYLKSIK